MSQTNGTNRAKLYQLALFPMNNGATNVYFVLILSYVATFGENILGLIGFASIMVALMRVFDAVTDPIFGSLMDKLNTKFGKFRPFMVVGNLVMAVSVTLLYIVTPAIPQDLMWLRYVAFTLLYAIWVIGYTLQTSVTRAGTSVITNDPKQRPLLNIFNAVGAILGMGVMNMLGIVLAGDNFMADYNESWFRVITPIGIVLSMLLTALAVIGIWHKDNEAYFGIGGKQEKIKIAEYIQIAKANKPLQRLMMAGGGCKLALSIATNVTVLCMLYGCMTQFGLGFSQGKPLQNLNVDATNQIVGMEFHQDSQVLAITLNGDALKFNESSKSNKLAKPYKFDSKTKIETLQVYKASDILVADENGNLSIAPDKKVDVIAFYVNDEGKAIPLALDASGMPKGLVTDSIGNILGLNSSESTRVIGVLVNDENQLINIENAPISVQYDAAGYLTGLKTSDIAQLSSRNRYDSLNLLMMVFGYICSAPFFLISAKTAQKHGQKKSLMTYVAMAFLFYIGVLITMLLWKFGNPAWNFAIYEGELFKSGFKITINFYTVLFLVFFGLGYGSYYATADMPIPMVADCSDYETYRSGKFIPGIIGTLFSLVDKLVSSLSATIVSLAVGIIGIAGLPTKATPYVNGMNWVVIVLFCLVPMAAWALTLLAMKGYALDGQKIKTIQAVNAARKEAVANGMSMEEAMATITDETVTAKEEA